MTEPGSRYAGLPIISASDPAGGRIPCLARRFLPQPERLAVIGEHPVALGDRLDNVAAAELDDPELFWRLADGNRAMRPAELCTGIGRLLRVTLPEGIPGAPDER